MLCSHRRSDQLDPPDHINSPIKPNKAGLNAHSRPLHDIKSILHDVLRLSGLFSTTTRPTSRLLLDHPNLYASHTRLQLDWSLLDRLSTRSLLKFFWHVKKIRVGSPSHADQGRPLPITHADRARPVPDRLIVLDRVYLIGGENTAFYCSGRSNLNRFFSIFISCFP
jgi:hypothetical protein